MIALLLLVGFLSVQPLSSARLSSIWCVQIADLCFKFETSPTSAVVINYAASNALEIQDPMLQLMPSLIVGTSRAIRGTSSSWYKVPKVY